MLRKQKCFLVHLKCPNHFRVICASSATNQSEVWGGRLMHLGRGMLATRQKCPITLVIITFSLFVASIYSPNFVCRIYFPHFSFIGSSFQQPPYRKNIQIQCQHHMTERFREAWYLSHNRPPTIFMATRHHQQPKLTSQRSTFQDQIVTQIFVSSFNHRAELEGWKAVIPTACGRTPCRGGPEPLPLIIFVFSVAPTSLRQTTYI